MLWVEKTACGAAKMSEGHFGGVAGVATKLQVRLRASFRSRDQGPAP